MGKVNDSGWIDAKLLESIASVLKKTPSDITKTTLYAVRELDLSNLKLQDLKGIEFAKNLTSLVLNNNNLKNVDNLQKLLNLRNLELNNNNISDISFVQNLKKLKSLSIEYNNISIIPSLSNLRFLTLLNISYNSINDFSFIDTLVNTQIKILATDQTVILSPVYINHGEDVCLNQSIKFEKNKDIFCDDIQVTGEYDDLITDESDFFLYSVSETTLKNIRSSCIIKSYFYHELLFSKAIILSGVLVQPIIMIPRKHNLCIEQLDSDLYSISGKLLLNPKEVLKDKVITIINSKGEKIYSTTNELGVFNFKSLKIDTYTLLFPFLNDYNYVTPSLYVINLKDNKSINIDAYVSIK